MRMLLNYGLFSGTKLDKTDDTFASLYLCPIYIAKTLLYNFKRPVNYWLVFFIIYSLFISSGDDYRDDCFGCNLRCSLE